MDNHNNENVTLEDLDDTVSVIHDLANKFRRQFINCYGYDPMEKEDEEQED